MANLPSAPDQSSQLDITKPRRGDKLREFVVEANRLGLSTARMARHLFPADEKKRKAMRKRLRYMAIHDKRLHAMIAAHAHGELALGLVPTTQALVKRAERGRPDAIKLIYEATGFHNPRVKHEHSGDIKIELSMPRPPRNEDDDNVVDAEVVEE